MREYDRDEPVIEEALTVKKVYTGAVLSLIELM